MKKAFGLNIVDLNFMKLSVKVPAFCPQRLSSYKPELYYSSLISLLNLRRKES
jgi:Ion transport protein